LVLFVVNTIFGCYIYRRLSSVDERDPTKHPKWNPALNYSRNQLVIQMDFWMNDPWVCIHICVTIFSIVWAIIGFVWVSDSNGSSTAVSPCPSPLSDASMAAAIIMLVFIGLGLMMIFFTLCTGYLEHCLNDCNILHCLCCCFYYPFFYRYDPNFESASQRQARERYQLRQQHQPLHPGGVSPVAVSPVVVVSQPVVHQQAPIVGVPMQHQQPTYQAPHVVVQPVMAQPVVQQGYMQTPAPQQDYQRRSYQSTPAATPATTSQPEPDNLEKAKIKAQAVAEATGDKLKEGAQAFKEWWNKPKDPPARN